MDGWRRWEEGVWLWMMTTEGRGRESGRRREGWTTGSSWQNLDHFRRPQISPEVYK